MSISLYKIGRLFFTISQLFAKTQTFSIITSLRIRLLLAMLTTEKMILLYDDYFIHLIIFATTRSNSAIIVKSKI